MVLYQVILVLNQAVLFLYQPAGIGLYQAVLVYIRWHWFISGGIGFISGGFVYTRWLLVLYQAV
jgi:hypothetical protein